jgi:hypothetical protein
MLLWNGIADLAKTKPSGKGRPPKSENVQVRYIDDDQQLPYGVLFISNQTVAFGETLSFKTFIQPPREKEDLQLEDKEKEKFENLRGDVLKFALERMKPKDLRTLAKVEGKISKKDLVEKICKELEQVPIPSSLSSHIVQQQQRMSRDIAEAMKTVYEEEKQKARMINDTTPLKTKIISFAAMTGIITISADRWVLVPSVLFPSRSRALPKPLARYIMLLVNQPSFPQSKDQQLQQKLPLIEKFSRVKRVEKEENSEESKRRKK